MAAVMLAQHCLLCDKDRTWAQRQMMLPMMAEVHLGFGGLHDFQVLHRRA